MKPTMMVCPHDTAKNPGRWYFLTQYAAMSGYPIHLEISLDFVDFHEQLGNADLVYANPQDALRLINDRGFSAIARSSGIYDEVVFIANHKIINPSLKSLDGQALATVTSLIPTSIGLSVLDREGIRPSEIKSADTWLMVFDLVRSGQVAYGFMYKDTYNGLSEDNRKSVNAFYVSAERQVFHSMCIGPTVAEHKEQWQQALLSMHTNADGKMALEELGFEKWLPVLDNEVEGIQKLVTLYSERI